MSDYTANGDVHHAKRVGLRNRFDRQQRRQRQQRVARPRQRRVPLGFAINGREVQRRT